MNFVTNIRMGYSSALVLNPKDFVALSEIIDRSMVVETRYHDSETYYVLQEPAKIDANSVSGSLVLTQARFDEIKAATEEGALS